MSVTSLTWYDIYVALQPGWLHPKDAISYANHHIIQAPSSLPDNLELELSYRKYDEPVLDIVSRLASREHIRDEKLALDKWLSIFLLWVCERRTQLTNPLSEVEDIWCEFEHPEALNKFIPWMPNPQRDGSLSEVEALELMRSEWAAYMEVVASEYHRSREH